MAEFLNTYKGLNKWIRVLISLVGGSLVAFLYRLFTFIETKETKTLIFGILALPFGLVFMILDVISIITKDDIAILV